MQKRNYIAYGSNLHKGQMAYRCPDAKPIAKGFIEGYELLFKGSKTGAYLTIEKKEGSKVPIVIWEVSADDEHCLDLYEGYPSFYYKKDIKAVGTSFEDGKEETYDCFVYIMHEDRKVAVPSKRYVDVCVKGYFDFELDIEFMLKALRKNERMAR